MTAEARRRAEMAKVIDAHRYTWHTMRLEGQGSPMNRENEMLVDALWPLVADAVAQAVKERDEQLAGRCPRCHGETADRMAAHLQAEVMESERVRELSEEIARLTHLHQLDHSLADQRAEEIARLKDRLKRLDGAADMRAETENHDLREEIARLRAVVQHHADGGDRMSQEALHDR